MKRLSRFTAAFTADSNQDKSHILLTVRARQYIFPIPHGGVRMIICFDCSVKTKKRIEDLLAAGGYGNVSELISVAVENQALLEARLGNGDALTIDQKLSRPDLVENGRPSGSKKKKRSARGSKTDVGGAVRGQAEGGAALFLLEGLEKISHPHSPLPDDYWMPGMVVPLDRWIFGQHNKLLPVKASCRGLAHLLRHEPKGVYCDAAANRLADEAVILGDLLVQCDGQHDTDRDRALSTAFPSSADHSGKARVRYANQFVASVNKHGQVSGALIDFKFINYKPGRNPRLSLTDKGWEFALMRNPILDGSCQADSVKFSEEEVSFFLDHIVSNVRAEDFAYCAILQAISDGANTPELLDKVLRESVPEERSQRVTSSFLSSQRSGAISRMSDLGLVERVREGVRVTYLATEFGRSFLLRQRPQGVNNE